MHGSLSTLYLHKFSTIHTNCYSPANHIRPSRWLEKFGSIASCLVQSQTKAALRDFPAREDLTSLTKIPQLHPTPQ